MIEYTISEARYCKNKVAVNTPSPDGYKTRAARLAGTFGRYSRRADGYVMSQGQADRFAKLYAAGWDASIMGEGAKSREAPKLPEATATVKYFDDNDKEVSREAFYFVEPEWSKKWRSDMEQTMRNIKMMKEERAQTRGQSS